MQDHEINGRYAHEFTSRPAKITSPHDARVDQHLAGCSREAQLNRQFIAHSKIFFAIEPHPAITQVSDDRGDFATVLGPYLDRHHQGVSDALSMIDEHSSISCLERFQCRLMRYRFLEHDVSAWYPGVVGRNRHHSRFLT